MQAQQVLHKILINTCPEMHKVRRDAIQATVIAALTGRRLSVTDLGRAIHSQTSHKHQIKRVDRLLSNSHLHGEVKGVYSALSHCLPGGQSRPLILIDWSDMDTYKQHFVLRASLALQGRSVTLYEEVHSIKTKEKLATHRAFLHELKALLPSQCTPIVVTDAGFRTTWFKLVESLGWDFVGRVRNRHYLRWTRGGRWFEAKQCYSQASTRPKYLGEGVLTVRNQVACQLIVYQGRGKGRKHHTRFGSIAENAYSRKKAQAQREPWLLATSLAASSNLAKRVVNIYRQRMQIEESFRDVKSHRFGLGLNYHRVHSAIRLQMLLLIAHIALIVIWLLGIATQLTQQHYQFQANTVRHKPVLSIIFIGLQMIHDKNVLLTSEDILAALDKFFELQYAY